MPASAVNWKPDASPDTAGSAGGVRSTENRRTAASPRLPARSIIRTRNVWLPSVTPLNVFGEVHAVNSAALSSAHSNVAPGSPLKVNRGDDVLTGPLGPDVTVGAGGGPVSTWIVSVVGSERFVALSSAVTVNSCVPSSTSISSAHRPSSSTGVVCVDGPLSRISVSGSAVPRNSTVELAMRAPFGRLRDHGRRGLDVSTVKLRTSGVLSRLPARSKARTDSVCGPWLSVGVVYGFGQSVCAAPSSAHSNFAPGSEANVNVGVSSFTCAFSVGPPVISVSGIWVSTVIVHGVGSLSLPAASVAVIAYWCVPSAGVRTIVQFPVPEAGTLPCDAPPSRIRTVLAGSAVPLNATVPVISSALFAGDVTTGGGGSAVSILKVCEAGVGSAFPTASVATTSNVCVPSASSAVVCGDVHAVNAPVPTRHWNVELLSVELNVNVGRLTLPGVSAGRR